MVSRCPPSPGRNLLVVDQGMSSPSVGVVESFGGSQNTIATRTVVVWFAPGSSVAMTLVKSAK